MRGHLADVINPAKFYLNRVRGFDFVGGSNFWIPHKKEKSPLTQGLNYRSACDDTEERLYERCQYYKRREWRWKDRVENLIRIRKSFI